MAHCVDNEHGIAKNHQYDNCTLYSSLDPNVPDWVVDKPENLDALNYLLNHQDEYLNDTNLGNLNLGAATYQDIMKAIWGVIDDISYDPNNLKVNFMVTEALANDGFVPEADDIMGIIVYCGANVQRTMIEVTRGDIELGSDTIWGQADGDIPFSHGWGSYFACSLP